MSLIARLLLLYMRCDNHQNEYVLQRIFVRLLHSPTIEVDPISFWAYGPRSDLELSHRGHRDPTTRLTQVGERPGQGGTVIGDQGQEPQSGRVRMVGLHVAPELL